MLIPVVFSFTAAPTARCHTLLISWLQMVSQHLGHFRGPLRLRIKQKSTDQTPRKSDFVQGGLKILTGYKDGNNQYVNIYFSRKFIHEGKCQKPNQGLSDRLSMHKTPGLTHSTVSFPPKPPNKQKRTVNQHLCPILQPMFYVEQFSLRFALGLHFTLLFFSSTMTLCEVTLLLNVLRISYINISFSPYLLFHFYVSPHSLKFMTVFSKYCFYKYCRCTDTYTQNLLSPGTVTHIYVHVFRADHLAGSLIAG